MTAWFALAGGCIGVWLGAWLLWFWFDRKLNRFFRTQPGAALTAIAVFLEKFGVHYVLVEAPNGEPIVVSVRACLISIERQLEIGASVTPDAVRSPDD